MTATRKIINLSRTELREIYESTDTVAEVAERYNTTEQVVQIVQQMRPVQPRAERDRLEPLREKLKSKATAKSSRLETKKQKASKQPRLLKKKSRTRKR